MFVTIVIPAFNVGQYIHLALESLEAQEMDAKDFEVVVINDGSTDDTSSVVRRFISRGKVGINLIEQPNQGVSAARNRGLELAKGEYVYFLDADDFISCDFLSKVNVVARRLSPDVFVTSYRKIGRDGGRLTFLNKGSYAEPCEFLLAYMKGMVNVNMCTFVFRREILLRDGHAFNQECRYGEDLEFYLKFIASCSRVAMVEDAFFNYVYREGSAVNVAAGAKWLDALTSLGRVEAYLKESQKFDSVVEVFQREFLPVHILKILHRLVLELEFEMAASVAAEKNNSYILKNSGLHGKNWFKAVAAGLFPKLYVRILYLISIVKRLDFKR